jgi:hypothetical protein
MYQQKRKDEVIKKIKRERKLLEKSLSNLTEQEMLLEGVVGEWSVKDILAHLMAWEILFLSWYESGLQGRLPDIAPVGMSRKAIDAVNERFFHQYENWPLKTVLTESRISYDKILAKIEAIPEEDIFKQGRFAWTGYLALEKYISGNTYNHYAWARLKIRQWIKGRNKSK